MTASDSSTLTRHSRRLGATTALALAMGLFVSFAAPPAAAQEFRLHVEPAVAFWVDEPQSSRFTPGFYFAVRPGVSLGRIVDLQWSYALLYSPAGDGFTADGTAHWLTAGVRLRPFAGMRPPQEQLGGFFVDFNLGYVNTDGLDRLGLDVGLGYGFQLTPAFSLGLVARYGHIVQPDSIMSQDPNDGQFVSVGLDLAFGPAYEASPPPPEELVCQECQTCVAPPEKICPVVQPCADSDRDGVCDIVDRCPTQAGPLSTYGCPTDPCNGPPLVMLVQFKYDSAQLPVVTADDPKSMDPVLDAVAKAISLDPTCRVCILGFASEEGSSDYNDLLSGRRAAAVQGYLHGRGLAVARMPTHGLGERCQLVPAGSLERNRRVEFRRLQENESCPRDCSQSQL
jgi:hypothetical protein